MKVVDILDANFSSQFFHNKQIILSVFKKMENEEDVYLQRRIAKARLLFKKK